MPLYKVWKPLTCSKKQTFLYPFLSPSLSFMLEQFMQILLETCSYRISTKNISRGLQVTAFPQRFLWVERYCLLGKLSKKPAWKQEESRALARIILRPWRRKRYVPPKSRLAFNELHSVTTQKTVLFITTAVRASNPAFSFSSVSPLSENNDTYT
jgi:hypothetical protein